MAPIALRVSPADGQVGLGPGDADTGGEKVIGCGGGIGGDDRLFGPLLAPTVQEVVDLADEFAAVRAVRDEAEFVGVLARRADR